MDLQQICYIHEVRSVKAKLTTYKTYKGDRREIEAASFLSLIGNQTNVSKYPSPALFIMAEKWTSVWIFPS